MDGSRLYHTCGRDDPVGTSPGVRSGGGGVVRVDVGGPESRQGWCDTGLLEGQWTRLDRVVSQDDGSRVMSGAGRTTSKVDSGGTPKRSGKWGQGKKKKTK